MLIDPPNHATSSATRMFLDTVRIKAPSLAERSNDDLLAIAAHVATLAYGGHYAAVWQAGAALGVPEFEWRMLCYETLTGLYHTAVIATQPGALKPFVRAFEKAAPRRERRRLRRSRRHAARMGKGKW
ncbi:hypothetical protein Q6346_04860 [Isoptericola sp. b490]|uniref:hypothetical protein n=1 Tax=Actinotalea lenta TaxID=3064654 RepID=UPI002713E469|nr:hypothetical protein [Isoptericola sp. b490]MDO8120643.1 hypothetical protein [Isoptericola sp. b490]